MLPLHKEEYEFDEATLKVRPLHHKHLLVVDDGVRIAQGARGQGLGFEDRSADDSSADGNGEAMWRDFE